MPDVIKKANTISARTLCVSLVFGVLALGGLASAQVASEGPRASDKPCLPASWPIEKATDRGAPYVFLAQTESRSYLEGRDFQSYQRDRGFAGDRNFGSYPDTWSGTQSQRPYSLKRPRIYGPSDNRCAGWSRRCAQSTSDAPGDFRSCMRYHGCR